MDESKTYEINIAGSLIELLAITSENNLILRGILESQIETKELIKSKNDNDVSEKVKIKLEESNKKINDYFIKQKESSKKFVLSQKP